jgi:MFS family permease
VLFIAPASALWGLLAVIAANQLSLSSSGYGLLLGALGVGAVMGAVVLSRLQALFGYNQLLAVAAVGFATATTVLATVHVLTVVLIALVLGGTSWLLTLSTLNASMQLSLPAWVRARGLSVYQLVFMGGQAIGSLIWGLVAGATSGVTALLISAALLAGCAVSVLWWPLHPATGTLDVTPSAHWGEPALVFEPDPLDGPVVVLQSYLVAPEDEAGFLALMHRVRRSRQRTGAMQWGIFRSGESADTFVELFVVRSWDEHLRQHLVRQTGLDLALEQELARFVHGESTLRHFIAVRTER